MEDKEGVYVGLLVSQESTRSLNNFFQKINLSLIQPNCIFDDRLHTTLIYSHTGKYDKVILNKIKLKVKPVKWEILTSATTGNKVLVLVLEKELLDPLHNKIKLENHLSHAFTDYHPHVSVHYDFKGDLPKEVPDFEIELNNIYTKHLSVSDLSKISLLRKKFGSQPKNDPINSAIF